MLSSDKLEWIGISGEYDAGPYILRYISNTSARPMLEVVLRIVWIYADVDTGAMPDEIESKAMADFEDLLVERLESDQLALLTAALTFDGARQWVWYTSSVSECASRINNLPPTDDPYPIELDAQEDPDWDYLNKEIVGPIAKDA